MLKLYHVPGTRSARIIWLCEELGLIYEVETISFKPEYRLSPEWLAKNPVGKVPAMEDGGLTLFESGAMVQYILDRYGNGRLEPSRGTNEHALYMQWSWFAEATFARPLGEIVNHRRNFDPPLPGAIEEMQGRARLCVTALNSALAGRDYLAGEFSAADIMTGYSLMLCERLAPWKDEPHVTRYWNALRERPAAIKALSSN